MVKRARYRAALCAFTSARGDGRDTAIVDGSSGRGSGVTVVGGGGDGGDGDEKVTGVAVVGGDGSGCDCSGKVA